MSHMKRLNAEVLRIAVRENVYIYRVLSPQRCTLALAKSGNRWVLSELKTCCNGEPSRETWNVVREWLVRGTGDSNDSQAEGEEPEWNPGEMAPDGIPF